ncbi:undecaprenyl-phosphate glucose phosphotransferase [soil metagenome]
MRLTDIASIFLLGLGLSLALNVSGNFSENNPYLRALLSGTLLFAVSAEVVGSYAADTQFSVWNGCARIFRAWLFTGIAMLVLAFLTKVSAEFSRVWVSLWFASGTVTLGFIRATGTLWMRNLQRQGIFDQRVAIFGAGAQGSALANYILANKDLPIDLIGFFDERSSARLSEHEAPQELTGDLENLFSRVRAGDVDQVIIALPLSATDRVQAIVSRFAVYPVLVRLAPDLSAFAFIDRPTAMLGKIPVMTMLERPISGISLVLKKLEDIVLGILIFLVASPIFLLTALAIMLEDGRPIFFCQEREGYNHRRFRIWKFRSMSHHCSQFDNIEQARRDDNRVTRVGRIIRRTSIDELPQLYNVFKGEMSLVGPRPHAPSTRVGEQVFSDVIINYAARYRVKPGITGWAQVCGWRGETDTEEKLQKRLQCDIFYIEHWSILFDFYVILRTAATVLFSRSTY